MIKDVIIIKDGLPLLNKNYDSNSGDSFSKSDNLIMMSGFFSAINSFSDQFDDMGSVSELRLSKNDMKLSFFIEPSMPNVVYLATFDEQTKGVNVQRTLRKLSKTFLQQYNINQILNWRGRRDTFKAFEEIIDQYVGEQEEESENDFRGKVINLFNTVKERFEPPCEPEAKTVVPNYYSFIPKSKMSKKINPYYYLSGRNSCNVFNSIDDKKDIHSISKDLEMEPEQVYNICKNLVKMGFIAI
ncbi:MAG: hypothetical protein EU535_08695 [Promethearchaeota archaeon]|nr:MAG: hypothetical protein EU535_08695 [Candidatus Lokiarchaeota archaeon]